MTTPLALYIHWPFCVSKCPYCDFNSHVRERFDEDDFLNHYLQELSHYAETLGDRTLSSIFFGGGTPSLMQPAYVEKILNHINQLWPLNDIEITLEANPATFEIERFKGFKAAGINRLSIGIQSLHDDALKFLGRTHSSAEALAALDAASRIFDRYSFDLIYALPNQSLNTWQDELTRALTLAGGHLSLYQLTIEKGTPFFTDYRDGKWHLPDDDLAADMYELTDSIMNMHHMPAYEVSNYARAGHESQHNLTYWRYGEYLGIGPGAHSRVNIDGKRTALMNIHTPEKWAEAVAHKNIGVQSTTMLDTQTMLEERLMMGLRIVEGIDIHTVESIINHDVLQQAITENLLSLDNATLATTLKGRLTLSGLTSALIK